MDIQGVELFGSKIEITFTDGSSEEVENGVYERKDVSEDTVEERVATADDVARLTMLADDFIAELPPITSTVAEVEREVGEIEVKYADGTSEEIEGAVYERKNVADQTVLERPATDEDIARIEALMVGDVVGDVIQPETPAEEPAPSTDDATGEEQPTADGDTETPAPPPLSDPPVAETPTATPDTPQTPEDQTMEILGVELFGEHVEIKYVDGTSEEVENGVYERKDANNVTIEERIATAEDLTRLTALANDFIAALPPIEAEVVEVEREAGKIEVTYADGTSEEIENGVYERKNAADQKLLERPATDADIARIEALAADAPVDDNGGDQGDDQGGATSDDDQPGDNPPATDQPDDRPEIFGDDGRDKIRGSDDAERIFGGDGRDDIRADDGDDLVDGGAGNDRLRGEDGADELIGGSGNDRLRGDDGDDTLDGGAGRDRLRGDNGDDMLDGGAGNDRLIGGRGDDSLSGGDGNDRIKGNAGADIALGGDGNDRVIGGGGEDTLSGGEGNDRVKGGGGADIVNGGGGDDRVIGGRGEDTLDGGSGSDRYNGGLGADTLIFEVDGVSDKINDFEDGLDLIDISAFGVTDIGAIIASGRQVGLDAVIDFGGGDTIVIEDTQLSQIGADDLIL